MKNLIGISGRMGSGKDTVGKIIRYLTCEPKPIDNADNCMRFVNAEPGSPEYIYLNNCSKYEIKKYADKLKDIACMLIGCTREQLENQDFKSTPLSSDWDDSHGINTPRELLQVLGTDCGRNMIHTNIWTISLFADYKPIHLEKQTSMGNVIDYTNCEFPNWIITDTRFPNELDYIKNRGGITIRVNTNRVNKVSTHESETALDNSKFDHVINNNGTYEELIDDVKEILYKENII